MDKQTKSDFAPIEVCFDLAGGHQSSFWINSQQMLDDRMRGLQDTYSTFIYRRVEGEDPRHPRLEKIIVYGPTNPPNIPPEVLERLEKMRTSGIGAENG